MLAFSSPVQLAVDAFRHSRVLRSPLTRGRHTAARIQPRASVSREDVEKTAKLASLALSEDEIAKLTPEFQKIIGFVDRMSQLDLTNVEPMARLHATHNVVRDDNPTMFPDVDAIMSEVPAIERDYVRVPKITSEGTD